MKSQPDTRNDRSPAAAVWGIAALTGAMLADLAETVADPANTDKAAKFYSAAAHHHDRMVVAAALLVVSALLIVAGVSGVTRAIRDRGRGRGLGITAYVLSLLGGAGHVALAAFYMVFATVPTSALTAAEGVSLIDHIVKSGEAKLLVPLAIAFPLAILATFLAAVRARAASRLLLVPVLAAPVVAIAGPISDAVATSAALCLFIAAAAMLANASRSGTPRVRRIASPATT